MPNHVTNRLKICGPTDKVQEFKIYIYDEKDHVNFGVIAPMPSIISTVESGVMEIAGDTVREWVLDELAPEGARKLTPDEEFALKLSGGGWYYWCINNWGTKWNAYSHGSISDVFIGDNLSSTVTFQTAWAYPDRWFERLCARVPAGVVVSLSFADEDFGANTGWAIKDDNGYDEQYMDAGSDEAMDHAADILGFDPREEDAEEEYERSLEEEWPDEPDEPVATRGIKSEDKPGSVPTGPAAEFESPADWETEVYN